MSVLQPESTHHEAPGTGWAAGRFALTAFLLVLAAGMVVVIGRTQRAAEAAHLAARREAAARLAALDGPVSRVSGAAATLAGLVRQAGGYPTNFQRAGADLLAAWPSVAWVDLEPGGVVRDIVPRAGHEGALGANILQDPVQRSGGLEAARTGLPAAALPVSLAPNEAVLVVRAPVALTGRDGRPVFLGFVGAGVRLRDLIGGAGLSVLGGEGYYYVLSCADTTRPGSGQVLDQHGMVRAAEGEVCSVSLRNLRFSLALQPRAGWHSTLKIAIAAVTVLVVSFVVWLAFHLLETSRVLEGALGDLNQRHDRVLAERKLAQESLATAQEELKRLRASLQQTEALAATYRARAEAAARGAGDSREQWEAKYKEAAADAQGLQARLDGAARSLKAMQEEVEESRSALAAARHDLEGALARVAAASEAASAAEAAQTRLLVAAGERAAAAEARQRELEEKLNAVPAVPDPDAALCEQVARQVGEIADLEARLASAAQAGAETAAEMAAAALRLEQLEDRNRRLKSRLAEIAAGTPAAPAPAPVPVPAPGLEAVAPPPPAEPAAADLVEPFDETGPVAEAGAAADPETLAGPGTTLEPADSAPEGAPAGSEPEPEPAAGAPGEAGPSAPGEAGSPPTGEVNSSEEKAARGPRARRPKREAEPDLFAAAGGEDLPARALSPALLRKAVHQILPLFAGSDPGASDCLRDNRTTFRAAFTPEGFEEFERSVGEGEFAGAMEQLKKAVRRHGLVV